MNEVEVNAGMQDENASEGDAIEQGVAGDENVSEQKDTGIRYRILIRTVNHTNVESFHWHEVVCEDDDTDRRYTPASKIWETDDINAALAEYTEMLKWHPANDITLLQPIDVDVLTQLHEQSSAMDNSAEGSNNMASDDDVDEDDTFGDEYNVEG